MDAVEFTEARTDARRWLIDSDRNVPHALFQRAFRSPRARRIRISDEGVVRETRRRAHFTPWEQLVAIALKPDYVVLATKPKPFMKIVVPRRAFPTEQDWLEFNSLVLTSRLPDKS